MVSCGCPIICPITLTDWLMDWFDVTLSPSWSDNSVSPLCWLLFSFPTSWRERFGLNRTPGNFWQRRWFEKVLEHFVSLQAVFEHHMLKTKTTQTAQTLGALFPPTSQSQLSEQFDRIHAIHSIHNYFMLLDSNQAKPCHHLTSEKWRERHNTKTTEGERERKREGERDASG